MKKNLVLGALAAALITGLSACKFPHPPPVPGPIQPPSPPNTTPAK